MSQQVEPVIVSGGQGSGKTTLLREMHARFDGPSIILTTKETEKTAIHEPPHRIVWANAQYPQDIAETRAWSLEKFPNRNVQIIVDEVQNAPTFQDGADNGPLKTMLHEDREAGIKTVIATQSPGDLRTRKNNYAPVQQCDYWIWVGPLKSWHAGFFNANGMSDMKELMPTEKFKYRVMQPIEALKPKQRIVEQGETDPDFS